jgi:HSP90 family molecular chaperone
VQRLHRCRKVTKMTKHTYALVHNDPYENDFDLLNLQIFFSQDELIDAVNKRINEYNGSDLDEEDEDEDNDDDEDEDDEESDDEDKELEKLVSRIKLFLANSADNEQMHTGYGDLDFMIVRKELKLHDAKTLH